MTSHFPFATTVHPSVASPSTFVEVRRVVSQHVIAALVSYGPSSSTSKQKKRGRSASTTNATLVLKVARRYFDVLRFLRGPRHGRSRRSFHFVSLQSTIDSNGRIARTKDFGAEEKLSQRYVTDTSQS